MFTILYLHRHPTKGVIVRAHPITFEDQTQAEVACMEVGEHYKAPAFLIEFDKPDIRPRLELVKPEPTIEGDALVIHK